MADLPIEDLLPKANYSIYTLVTMDSNRALELSEGRRCLVANPSSEKLTTMALEEIAQGKIESKEAAALRAASVQRQPQDEKAEK